MRLVIKFLLPLLVFSGFTAYAQDSVLNVGSFEDYVKLTGLMKTWEPVQETGTAAIDPAVFTGSAEQPDKTNFSRPRYYLLELLNNTEDEIRTVYFYPGKMVNASIFHRDTTGRFTEIVSRDAFRAISLSSSLTLAPLQLRRGVREQFIIKPDLRYYNWTEWKPAVAHPTAINDLMLREFIQPNFTYSVLTILMAGMMFMLFSYSFLKFYLNKRSEYLYNSLFAVSFLLFFTVVFADNFYYQDWWHRYSAFFRNWLQMLGYIFELVFVVQFLELRSKRPEVFSFIRTVIIALMVYCCVLPFTAFSDRLYPLNQALLNAVTIGLLVAGVYIAISVYSKQRQLARYISLGILSLAFVVLVIILQRTFFNDRQYLLSKIGGIVVLYHAGILMNLFCFRLALGQKERAEELQKLEDIEKLQLENEKKELEKVLAIASSRVDERNRIAKEIHDDIGSGLTSIRLLSEIALVKRDNKDELNKISSNANELVNNLNEIIWSINSRNDTLPNLLAYIRSHMVDYLEPYNLKLSINIPPQIPMIEISGEKRRNIFMVIKECFSNIIKHAHADAVNFTVQVRDELIFTIKDNGKGFNSEDVLPFKNGIRNMRERIEHVGGELDIRGKNGTTIMIKIPLNGNSAHL
ncbi:MAG TPA: sensor histidine kinase [Chitinophagaceae bacterium]